MKIGKDSAARRQRWLEGQKTHGIVEAPKQTEDTTQPADDGNI